MNAEPEPPADPLAPPPLEARVDILATMVNELHDRIDWLENHLAFNAVAILRNPRDIQDPHVLAMHVIIHGLVRICRDVDTLTKAVAQLTAIDPLAVDAVFKVKLPAGTGECSNPNCRRWCSGGKDRLRSGRCNTCRVYRDDHDGADRPHPLCHETPVGGCDECERATAVA